MPALMSSSIASMVTFRGIIVAGSEADCQDRFLVWVFSHGAISSVMCGIELTSAKCIFQVPLNFWGIGREVFKIPFLQRLSKSSSTAGGSRLVCFRAALLPKTLSGSSMHQNLSLMKKHDLVGPFVGIIHIMGCHEDRDALTLSGGSTIWLTMVVCLGSRAAAGSSKMIMSGCITRMSAMETCFFWPPLKAVGGFMAEGGDLQIIQ